MTWLDATSDAGLVLFFGAAALFLLCVFPPLVLWLAESWDQWRAERRRNRPYRARKYADP